MYCEKPTETPAIEIPAGDIIADGLQAMYLFNEQGKRVFDWTQNGNDLSVYYGNFGSDKDVGSGFACTANNHGLILDNTNQVVSSKKGTIIIKFKSFGPFGDGVSHGLFGRWANIFGVGNLAISKFSNNQLYFILQDSIAVSRFITLYAASVPTWQTGTQIAMLWDNVNPIFNGDNISANINGVHTVPDRSINATSWTNFAIRTALAIGNDYSDTTHFCNGIISYCLIYNKVLSETTLKYIKNNTWDWAY
jgi:hypothetical protein